MGYCEPYEMAVTLNGEKSTAKFWSAIGYHAALEISKKKNISVGMVFCCKGATVIESRLPEEIVLKPEY